MIVGLVDAFGLKSWLAARFRAELLLLGHSLLGLIKWSGHLFWVFCVLLNETVLGFDFAEWRLLGLLVDVLLTVYFQQLLVNGTIQSVGCVQIDARVGLKLVKRGGAGFLEFRVILWKQTVFAACFILKSSLTCSS